MVILLPLERSKQCVVRGKEKRVGADLEGLYVPGPQSTATAFPPGTAALLPGAPLDFETDLI